jgi:hypothetical protein
MRLPAWPKPATRWPRPDFLARPARAPWLAWAWLVAGALALAVAAQDVVTVVEQRESVRRELDRWQAVRPRAPSPVPAAAPRVAPQAVAAARAVADQLAHPWERWLMAVERHAAPGVQWLSLEHDVAGGSLRLTGSAPARDQVVRTLEALALQPGVDDLLLVRIETLAPTAGQAATGTGPAAWRFELALRMVGASQPAGGDR